MKKFFTKVLSVLEAIGRSRAAAELARTGHYAQAQNLIK